MVQSNGENAQRNQRGLHQIRSAIQTRSLLAKKRVENITKSDVKGFFTRNAFVLLTVAAVILGECEPFLCSIRHCLDLKPPLHHHSTPPLIHA